MRAAGTDREVTGGSKGLDGMTQGSLCPPLHPMTDPGGSALSWLRVGKGWTFSIKGQRGTFLGFVAAWSLSRGLLCYNP